ncbi:hypothetical protein M426DRAFT_8223 [Hypoxylon sp. CI-4A]|nr:hypothetical protein M426DRAFT_8223 [Hypoxylon sp. CI-4A]
MAMPTHWWAFTAMATLALLSTTEAGVDKCNGITVSDVRPQWAWETGKELTRKQTLPVLVNPTSLLYHLKQLETISYLSEGAGRVVGTLGHEQTVEYIEKYLHGLGYYTEFQPVTSTSQLVSSAILSVNGQTDFHVEPMTWSPSGSFSDRPLVRIDRGGCHENDYPQDTLGAVVLVTDGKCSFSQKSIAAGQAGASALLLSETTQLRPSLDEWNIHHIPSARIPHEEAQDILDHSRSLWIDTLTIQTAYQREYGNESDTLLVGTHTDSANSSAGINDSGSGIASLLEVGAQLARFNTNSRVKFAFWTGGDAGSTGSRHYVKNAFKEELEKIRLYVDVNMVGSLNGALMIYDANSTVAPRAARHSGSSHAETTLAQGFKAQGIPFTTTKISGRSDYAPFLNRSIPIAGLFSGANGFKTPDEASLFGGEARLPYDPNYRLPSDDMGNINMTILSLNTRALAHIVGVYGKSFEGFPSRSTRQYLATSKSINLVVLGWVAYFVLSYVL